MYTVNWCEWEDILNETFIPLIDNLDRYIICKGGRGSGKSDWAAKKLIYRCLTENYFRYILVRNQYNSIKDSSYETIKQIVYDLGLQDLFEFKVQPLEICCINGNKFIARGCDDAKKLKSIKDPTGVWYEEDIPTEADFITITSSVRTTKADYLQEIFTINPEVEGNYQDHWFWIRYFKDKPENENFSDLTTIRITRFNAETKKMEERDIDLTYTVHHSTYHDNKWIPDEFVAALMALKTQNPYYYTIYCLGHWGNKQLGGLFYKNFNVGRNTYNYQYNPNIPLHISFDFNVNPYMSCSIWQIVGKAIYLIDEIAGKSPQNSTPAVCKEFKKKYFAHRAGLFVYGDRNGKNEDTRTDKGQNDFKIIATELEIFRPTVRVPSMNPPVAMRGNFINAIFGENFDDISIFLFESSIYLKNDLLFGKEDSDGTKFKEKVKGEDGRQYEKYHHFSDTMDYMVCAAFNDSFSKFQNGPAAVVMRAGRHIPNQSSRL